MKEQKLEPKTFDAVVIGAGPGGYVCAIRLAQLGKKTAIVEKDLLGGVCLNIGCIPSKALIFAASQYWKIKNEYSEMGIEAPEVECDLKKMQHWKSSVVQKLTQGVGALLKANGVEIIKGVASFESDGILSIQSVKEKESIKQQIKAQSYVIATGSRSMDLPMLALNKQNILSSTEALELEHVPKKMIVVGGGFIGLEIGTLYAKLGASVTIVEAMDQLLPGMDPELVGVVEKKLKKLEIEVLLKAKAQGLKEKDAATSKTLHLVIEKMGEGPKTLEADVILVSIGRKPNSENLGLEKLGIAINKQGYIQTDSQGKTNVNGIYAIGDVTGNPLLAHRASMDGLLVASCIAGENSHKDYKTVPWAVFSDPEIASCGLSEKEATDRGFKFKVGRFPFAASGRALSTRETEGFIKVLVNESDESLLGVHMVGPEVSNLIAEAALAIEMGACAEDIMRTIHTHPTLPESFAEAVENALGKAIHIYKPLRK